MSKLNLKNEVLTASKMQSIKGGGDEPVYQRPTITSGSDPRPKPPVGGGILGSMVLFQGGFSVQQGQDKTEAGDVSNWWD